MRKSLQRQSLQKLTQTEIDSTETEITETEATEAESTEVEATESAVSTVSINGVEVSAPKSVVAYVSLDGENYFEVGELVLENCATGTCWAMLDDAKAVGQYVRVEVTCADTWTLLNEVEAYGTEYTESETNNIALGKSYVAAGYSGSPYTANLTDGKASKIFQPDVNNTSWFGFVNTGDNSTSNAPGDKGIVVLDLGAPCEITGVSTNVFAGENTAGVDDPLHVNIYYSNDGESYNFMQTIDQTPNASAPYWFSYTSPEPVYARYIKLAYLLESGTTTLTNEIEVYGTQIIQSDNVADPTSLVTLSGDFNSWNSTPNMKKVDEDTVSTTMKLDAGTYQFKILSNNVWHGNSGIIENSTTATSATGWVMDSDANCTLEASDGTYTFTYKISTNTLYVYHGQYSLVGFINGSDVGFDTDAMNPGYEFRDGQVTVTIDRNSYVFVKLLDNSDKFMFDEYCTDTTGVLKSATTGASEKMLVSAGVVTFTLTESEDGTLSLSYEVAPEPETTEPESTQATDPAKKEYSLVGYINGNNFGSQGDESNPGYVFTDGEVTVTFDRDSYVFVKTTDNSVWYMFDAYCTEKTGTLSIADEDTTEKMLVPAGEYVFTLLENEDGTLTLSYRGVDEETDPVVDVSYSLIGLINGKNVGCENDYNNAPNQFKESITLNITEESYVYVKTTDNQKWYMADGWQGTNTSAVMYDMAQGIKLPNKLYVPVGEITLTESQVELIEKAPYVGFIRGNNNTHRTYRTGAYNVLKAPVDATGAYAKKKKSIADLEGHTFIITDCVESGSQELRSYTGYWLSPAE